MKDLSQEYKAFTGISKDMDGEVKFVLKTDEIRAKVTEKNVAKIQLIPTTTKKTEKKSFIKWLLGLLHISNLR
ncbi:hypothetical protein [Caldicellulosiruptor acetigenus]|uniref:hypothetical protein n=1 Tax=Caldicellulosiruptor acetigenus TaxID=301953 RepID=UPI0001E9C237|nr:hypothetical protein [Caldicellulosiruptor acetigenus]